jgi:hypothetical protein
MLIHRLSRSHRRRIWGDYYKKVLSYDPTAYWPLWEPSGSVARCLVNPAQNGSYTGVTLGQPGIGDGHTAPLFDGANDYLNIGSATLLTALNGAEWTVMQWVKASGSGVWTDSAERKLVYLPASDGNFIFTRKSSNSNQVDVAYKAGGITKVASHTSFSPTTFFCMMSTCSATADAMKLYIDGIQRGGTQSSLGTWAHTFSAALIGALSAAPSQVWDGCLAHVALFGSALSPAAILDLATR